MPDEVAENRDLERIKQLLDNAESYIRQVKSLLFASEIQRKAISLPEEESGSIIEGVFDGENMIGPDTKKYPVPANYASKSKLIPGDILKLTILGDGSFVFKQIGPVKRKKLTGTLEELDRGKYVVRVNDNIYRILLASVTYFHADIGDSLTVVVPAESESEWAAVENVLDSSSSL